MDYTPQTWVDDDGSGATGTVYTAARMSTIEAGVQDAAQHHKIGLDSAKPAAIAANKNWRYYATDTGIEYQSDGVTWTPLYPVTTSSLKSSGSISAGPITSGTAGGGGQAGAWLDPLGKLQLVRSASTGVAFNASSTTDTNNRIVVLADGTIQIGSGSAPPDLSMYRDTSARLHIDSTVAADTGAIIRNKSATGFSGWQLNDQNDVARGFIGWANDAVTANQYMRINPGTNPLRLMYNAVTRYENNGTGMAWWGNTPIARPARPTTLTEVINLIANYGLSL